jgi:hypothetical protein
MIWLRPEGMPRYIEWRDDQLWFMWVDLYWVEGVPYGCYHVILDTGQELGYPHLMGNIIRQIRKLVKKSKPVGPAPSRAV